MLGRNLAYQFDKGLKCISAYHKCRVLLGLSTKCIQKWIAN